MRILTAKLPPALCCAWLVVTMGVACRGPQRELPVQPAVRASLPTSASMQAGAPLFRIREEDEDSGRHEVAAGGGVVDINSRLHIRLDKDLLRERLRAEYGLESFSQKDLELLRTLQGAAEEGLQSLTRLRPAMAGFRAAAASGPPTAQDVQSLQSGLAAAASVGANLLSRAIDGDLADTPLAARIERRLAEGGILSTEQQYSICFEECAHEAETLRTALDAELHEQAIFVQLGAWAITASRPTPLHLAGFDEYPEGEYYRVERWRVAPNSEQVRLIEELQRVSRDLNQGDAHLTEIVRSLAHSTAKGTLALVQQCVDEIRTDLTGLAAEGERIVELLRQRIAELQRAVQAYAVLVSTRVTKYLDTDYLERLTLDELLRALQGDYEEIRRATESLVAQLRGLLDPTAYLDPDNDDPDALQRIEALLERIEGCVDELEGQVRVLATQLTSMFGIQLSSERINTAALEFGDEVLRHDIRSLPEESVLDLEFTGVRAENDSVLFKLGTGRVDPVTGQAREAVRQLQALYVDLFQVLVHFDTSVNLIFADPNGAAGLSNRWQFAPSYSVMLKWGSRDHPLYNRLIDAGFGLNLAILDFDSDDNPELGIGAVVSLLRDILQAGYGYNLNEDRWYGFFGIGLPLSTIQNALN